MNASNLVGQFATEGIFLYLDGDRLRYRAPAGVMTSELRRNVEVQREHILAELRNRNMLIPPGHRCANCEPQKWIDALPHDGRIRTTCGACGRFIGYRPADLRRNGELT